MKKLIVAAFVVMLGCTPAFCQQQLNAATKEDVEELLTLTGARARVQQIWAAMGQQQTSTAVDSYRLKHPDATPLELRKVAEATGRSFQDGIAVFSVDELIDAIIPVYQQHLTHADIRGLIEFYNSELGQKYLKEQSAMQTESMQAIQPIIKKHLPEIQAAAEKAIQESVKDAPADKAGDTSKSRGGLPGLTCSAENRYTSMVCLYYQSRQGRP